MSSHEIETYVDLWLSVKPFVNPKDKQEACEKFLSVINDTVCELEEVYDEWVGFDNTLDKAIRDNYISSDDADEYNTDEEADW